MAFDIARTALLAVILLVGYGVAKCIYNVCFHPLRHVPGPKLWVATALFSARNNVSGYPHKKILELHLQYGDVVRVGPNELSFSHADAWKEVCGHMKKGQEENIKDPKMMNPNMDGSIISASRERHGPLRRLLSHAFSARAMAEQQPLINGYIDLFMKRIVEHGEGGKKTLNMTKWFEWTTFDIVGDLAFGEAFGCLERSASHVWVDMFFDLLAFVPYMQSIEYLPFVDILRIPYFIALLPKRLANIREKSQTFSREYLKKRLSLGTSRSDFVDCMISKKDVYNMSEMEIVDTCVLLIGAGSETTATTLASVTYFLASHPKILAKLCDEVRSKFKSENEIDINSVQELSYMLAVIKETMRIHPAVALSIPRISPANGTQINGMYIPGGVTLNIWQYALYHNPKHFAQPEAFIPERWLGDARFDNDNKAVHQPFSYGPRNCIGMNLAYTEMQLILARIIFNFDMKMDPSCIGWSKDQELFFFWDKPDLNISYTPRQM